MDAPYSKFFEQILMKNIFIDFEYYCNSSLSFLYVDYHFMLTKKCNFDIILQGDHDKTVENKYCIYKELTQAYLFFW